MKQRQAPRWIGWLIAAAGAGMMAFGIWRGEMSVVFAKAVKTCLECIGIG